MNVNCYLCGSKDCKLISEINKKPREETDFKIKNYKREIYFCNNCKVYFNHHNYDLQSIYSGKYNEATYRNQIKKKYEKILALPFSSSDNKHRVNRIIDFLKSKDFSFNTSKILDIGSGLCVFLGELKKYGFDCYCLDPDPISSEHALKNVGVKESYCGRLENFHSNLKFDIITFNKVLEHIKSPADALRKASYYLKDKGVIYIELPDAENALKKGSLKDREEFFIEHYYIFTKDSVKYLINSIKNLKILTIESIEEPSGKCTIYAFIEKVA